MSSLYEQRSVSEMTLDGFCSEYINKWRRVYHATGFDLRDLGDGVDADEFIEAFENNDVDEMYRTAFFD